ncbi:MAG: AAA family ATPase [Elainellaceae cyanobacterium]
MEILSVTLKNFKSHSDRQFEFQPGTNAICGENGAGKTSILEAIAWTLFNYRGSYKNEDLIRNGSGSAQAIVRLVSSRDGRTYEVQRCTSRGYTLYDPQLDQRLPYKHIEDEVLPWLRQHMGIAPSTDLGRLFANTIGVPQGTFTLDFLQPAEKRKPIFDAILKVDDYQTAYRQGLALEKYAKAEIEKIEGAIAQYEERLQDWEMLQAKQLELREAIARDEAALTRIQSDLVELSEKKEQLAAQANQVQASDNQIQHLLTQIEGKHAANQLLEQSLQRAKQAVETCKTHQSSYQIVLDAETKLNALDQQVKQRQALINQRDRHEKQLAQCQSDLARLSVQREQIAHARAELEQLHPRIQQQLDLETQQHQAIEQLQQLHAVALEHQALSAQMQKLRATHARITQDIQRIQALAASVSQIAELEAQRDRLQEQMSRVDAARQFEAELQQLVATSEEKRDRHQVDVHDALKILADVQRVVPLLAANSVEVALSTIQAGVELNTELLDALQGILADLSAQVSTEQLAYELASVRRRLDLAYQQRAELATLDSKQAHQTEIDAELHHLQTQMTELDAQLSTRDQWCQARSHIEASLKHLGDPRGRSQLIQQQLQQHDSLEAAYIHAKTNQAAIQQAIDTLTHQLADAADLDTQIDHQKRLRQTHQAGYLAYVQQEADAQRLPTLEQDFRMAIAELQTLQTRRDELQSQLDSLRQTYNPDEWQQVEAHYRDSRSQADRIEGSLPQQRRLLNELNNRIADLKDVAEKRDRAQAELKERNRIRRFISFARKAYKEAGPRITERYVHSISREADRLFRELLNRQNVGLEWTRDYEILVQEGPHSRRFINLSGGEQMCAALAVRLALLRVLADVDIAFFDEPTTNMDRPRRERLAEAIANIRSFHQLFVISHDDTFEKVTENIILVMRDD